MSGTVARARQPTPRWLRLLTALGLIGLSATFLTWMFWGWIAYWIWGQSNEVIESSAPAREFSMGEPLKEKTADLPAPPPPSHQQSADPIAPPPVAPPVPTPPPPDNKLPTVRPMAVWQATNLPPVASAATSPQHPSDDDDIGGAGTAKDSSYAKDMQATMVSDARPKYRRFPPRYTIRKGQTFDCTPPMPIDTQLPGPLWCDVDKNVYSMDGTTILIPAHSTANATLEHGLGLGQDRAVLVFTDILTAGPDFLEIPLGSSQGASELGQNGVPVDVSEHTWAKIKTTAMLAGIEGLSSALTASLQHGGGNSQFNFGSFTGAGQSLASIALQHDINLPTTGYRGPGRSIKVYVNHYIDLSNFYSTTLVRGR